MTAGVKSFLKTHLPEEKEMMKSYSDIDIVKLEERVKELENDIAKLKQVEEKLKESENSLANAQRIAHLGNWEWDIVNNILHWSDEIYRIFGLVPQSFGATYEAFLNCVHPDDREFVMKSVNDTLYEKKPYSVDHRIVLPDGTERVVHEQAEVIFDSTTGKAVQMNGTVHDITERKRVEEEINLFHAITIAIAEADDFHTALNMVLHKVCESTGWIYGEAWIPSPDGRYLNFAQAWYDSDEDLEGFVKQSETFSFLPGVGMPGRVWDSGKPEWRHDATVDGNFPRAKICAEYSFKAAMSVPVIAGNNVIAVLIFLVRKQQKEDERLIKLVSTVAVQLGAIVQRKKAEEELRRLSTVIDQSINTIFITDIKGTIEYVNPMFVQVTGYTKEEAIGQNPSILASGGTTHAEYEELWKTIVAGKTWRGVFKNKKKDGQYYWGSGVISPIRNEKGHITHFLAVQEDITEKMKSEERIRYLAAYDELTGLYNRTHFMTILNEWILHTQNNNKTGVILLINIDKFRLNNDAYGHSVGDRLLHRIAELLQNTIADIDSLHPRSDVGKSFIGRMGGDEFAIFLPFRDEKEGIEAAEYVRKKIEKFRAVEITGRLTASIGIVLYPSHGITINELFIKADAAVYYAKEMGQNRIHLYHPENRILEKMHLRIRWKEEIQKAIEEDRFVPWFQPILNLKNNEIHHYEALVRIYTQDGKIILPSSFIDVAETLGLVSVIDRIVIKKAIKFLSHLNGKGKFPSFSINLSGKDFSDEKLFEYLKSNILEIQVDPRYLIFEITETSAIRDLDSAVEFIKELRSIGCSISLDDFGVGFTSFRYLKELEVDYIKIDGSFIKNLHGDCHDQLFVKAIADVAKGMKIKTIAEFVEHEETMKILKEFDIDYVQGYFIGKPSPEIS